MSWFSHVRQDLLQQPSTITPPFGTTEHNKIYSSPPSLADFPNAPPHFKPLPLVDLVCTPLGSRSGRVSPPLSFVTLQEQRCVLSWFLGWGAIQKQQFLEDLIAKAVPGKVCSLVEQLTTMQVAYTNMNDTVSSYGYVDEHNCSQSSRLFKESQILFVTVCHSGEGPAS